jgi:hypothetical protein
MITIIKSQFTSPGVAGDFEFMIEQPEHQRTLFVFNDNEEQFLAHFVSASNPFGAVALRIEPVSPSSGADACSPGGGNAVIRPYQCGPHPRAIGVPTGSYQKEKPDYFKGYKVLDAHVSKMVGHSMMQIDAMLASGRFDSLAFSYNPETNLGGRIFDTAQVVRDFIVNELVRVAKRH